MDFDSTVNTIKEFFQGLVTNFGAGTVVDGIILLFLLFTMIMGARRGFALTMIGFAQWFVCVILGFVFCGRVKGLLISYTSYDSFLKKHVSDYLQGSFTSSSTYKSMPSLFGNMLSDETQTMVSDLTQQIVSILLTISAFLIIVLGIKIICWLIVRLFSKKFHDGPMGCFDGMLGFIFGGIKGFIIVLIILAALVPVFGLIWPTLSKVAVAAIAKSQLGNYLYENNFLLIVIRDFFS